MAVGSVIASLVVNVAADVSELKRNLEQTQNTVAKAAKAIAGMWAVQEAYQATRAVMEYADSMENLSRRTDIGVEALQRFEYAAGASGVELQTLTSAMGQMQIKLAGGGASVVSALTELGLTLADLRSMRPEEQFTVIVERLGTVEDANRKALLATELFGRQGGLAMAQLGEDFLATARDASVMSADTIHSLAELNNQIEKLQHDLRVGFGSAFVWLAEKGTQAFDALVFAASAAVEKVAGIMASISKYAEKVPGASWLGVDSAKFRELADAAGQWKEAALHARDANTQAAAAAGKHGEAIEAVQGNYQEALKEFEAAEKHAKEIAAISDQLFGVDKVQKASAYVEALGGVKNLSRLTAEGLRELETTLKAAESPMAALGMKASATARQIGEVSQAIAAMRTITGGIEAAKPELGLGGLLGNLGTQAPLEALQITPQMAAAEWSKFYTDWMAADQAAWASHEAAASAALDSTTAGVTSANQQITDSNAQMQTAAAMGWSGFAVACNNAVDSALGGLARFRVGTVEAMRSAEELAAVMDYDAAMWKASGGWYIGPSNVQQYLAGKSPNLPAAIGAGRGLQFQAGGIGDFGRGTPAMLHGREAIIPLDKAGGLGGTVIVNIEGGNFYDTPQSEARLAARVGEAVMSRMRQKGERF